MHIIKTVGHMSILLLASGQLIAKTPMFKQLAGPAEEVELMQKAKPEASALISKTAMIPVNFNQGNLNWTKSLIIDGENPTVMLFARDSQDWQVQIQSHSNLKSMPLEDITWNSYSTTYGIGNEQFPAIRYEMSNLPSGQYEFSVKAKHADEGYLLLSSESPHRLKSYSSQAGYLVGQTINLQASAFTDEKQFTVVNKDLSLMGNASVLVTRPDGTTFERVMFDDGLDLDKSALDGEFSGTFVAEQAGLYQVQVKAQGITPEGKPFFRTVEHVIPVINDHMSLNAKAVVGQYSGSHKIDLGLGVKSDLKGSHNYRVIAEVWGLNHAKKAQEPVTWLSTMAQIEQGQIKLQLDDRWLIGSGMSEYKLKNIRIEDATHYISVLEVPELPLQLPQLKSGNVTSYNGEITESMLQGERPVALKSGNKAGGNKLMLVHGYCSSDVWGSVQSQFSNSVKFSDFDQNRSHDQFAQLIDSYGDNFDSFGVVAHSQGGAASLHLYTYYWSGLDNADSGRLIQSVGTPYQGTPLAGNLAALGNVFGVGCGYNSNLTTSGASSWLAGIPTWARSKVNYYTTAFTDKWWRPDWCNIATDVFLSDPDDGVIEKSRGQLSGATNRGHKSGQCHTSGMRDMAQTKDSGRNSTMSSNAAR